MRAVCRELGCLCCECRKFNALLCCLARPIHCPGTQLYDPQFDCPDRVPVGKTALDPVRYCEHFEPKEEGGKTDADT